MCTAVAIGIFSGIMSIGATIAQTNAQNRQIEAANLRDELQFDYDMLSAENQRNREENLAMLNEQEMQMNEELATIAYANKMNQANLKLRELQQKTAQEKRQANLKARESAGSILATGRFGVSVTNLLADVERDLGQFDYFSDRNLAFATGGIQQEKVGFLTEKASRIASIAPYLKRTILDPVPPTPRPGVSVSPFAIGSAVMGGINAGVNYKIANP
tara:strand:+ start:1259 stop:1909 length:651 start_codon:yes stop_codon:yes gene_type:complete